MLWLIFNTYAFSLWNLFLQVELIFITLDNFLCLNNIELNMNELSG